MQLLIYDTQDFRVSGGHVTGRCQGLFPPLPTSKGKALGTRLTCINIKVDDAIGYCLVLINKMRRGLSLTYSTLIIIR